MLEKLLLEIEHLKRSHVLLKQVYTELDPYSGGTIEGELLYEIREHFGFDDSE